MKLLSTYSLAALACTVFAEDAYLWTVDHGTAKHANTQASSITSETASSIIARRRGILSDTHLSNIGNSLLRDIKQYGGHQVTIGGATPNQMPVKVLVRISGYTGSVSEFPSLPDLWVEDATKDLADDFKARKDVNGICEYNVPTPMKKGVDLVYSYSPEGSSCMSASELQIQPDVLALISAIPTANDAPKHLNSLLRVLSHLSLTENIESTLLILPPISKLHKAKSGRRADGTEEPINKLLAASKSASSRVSVASSNLTLPRIIPQCFSALDSCESTTNACSGHGSCYKAYNGCYKCKCGTTIARVNSDGTVKTVQWGGNACQKKDVSVQFVLFASLSVVLAAIVGGGIGALYQMGSQDLPSVLGAGVGGAKQQK